MKHTPFGIWLVLVAASSLACSNKPSESASGSEPNPPAQPGVEAKAEGGQAGPKSGTVPSKSDPSPTQTADPVPVVAKAEPASAEPAEPAKPDSPRAVVLGLERFGEVKQHAAFMLATAWTEAPKWGKSTFMPKAELESMEPTVLQLSTTCGGVCDPAKVAGNIQESLEGRVEGSKRPNLNTGDAALDAVRANVEVIKTQRGEGLAIQAIRITYDAELMKKGPYRPRFLVDCYAWRPTDDYYVLLNASGPLASEATHLPTILEMCQSLKTVDAPAKAEVKAVP